MYKVMYYNVTSPTALEKWLNDMHKDGWDLVAVNNDYFIFIDNPLSATRIKNEELKK